MGSLIYLTFQVHIIIIVHSCFTVDIIASNDDKLKKKQLMFFSFPLILFISKTYFLACEQCS